PSAMISTNHSILIPSERSRHATQQKNVRKPQYASYSVAIDHGLAANPLHALHKLTCTLVRMVITVMTTKIRPNSAFRNTFIRPSPQPALQRLIYYVSAAASDVPRPVGPRGPTPFPHPVNR